MSSKVNCAATAAIQRYSDKFAKSPVDAKPEDIFKSLPYKEKLALLRHVPAERLWNIHNLLVRKRRGSVTVH